MSEFREIARHPKYEISDAGVIRHKESKRILKPTPSNNGNLRVKLDNRTEYVARLVAETYVAKMEDHYTDVRCIDGNKRNVSRQNLEWATHRQTQCDSFKDLGHAPGGAVPPKSIIDTETNIKYESIRSCARSTGFPPVKIRRMLKRGIRFEYF